MIVHIVLFRWKTRTSENQIQKIFESFTGLKELEGIMELRCGKNFSEYSKGYTHGLVLVLKDRKSLDNYRKHPRHLKITKEIEKIEDDSIGFDFEV